MGQLFSAFQDKLVLASKRTTKDKQEEIEDDDLNVEGDKKQEEADKFTPARVKNITSKFKVRLVW